MQNSLFISSSKYIKRIGALLLLVITVALAFHQFARVTGKYQDPVLYDFYDLKRNSVDVLFVGSSHVYCSINPVQLFEDKGIAGFNLAGGSQPVWFSYHYIKEALKTQSPKVIVLDVYTVRVNDDAYFDSRNAQMNLLHMKPSYNKWQALQLAEVDSRIDVFFGFPITHSRYLSLQKVDFDEESTMFLGYHYQPRIVAYEPEKVKDVRQMQETEAVTPKTEEYLRKCIELCREKGIDLVLTNSPWPDITLDLQKRYNYIQEIADEYGIPFLNGCLYNEEIGMDYTVDSMGDGGHLNYTGATKYTRWLGDYLKQNYELPDRRGSKGYEAWEHQSRRLAAILRRDEWKKLEDMGEYLERLASSEELYYVISLNGDFQKEGSSVLDALAGRGFDTEKNGLYVMNAEETLFYSEGAEEYTWWKYFGDSVLHVQNREGVQEIFWDGDKFSKIKNGVHIWVYDSTLHEVVRKLSFDADKNYEKAE